MSAQETPPVEASGPMLARGARRKCEARCKCGGCRATRWLPHAILLVALALRLTDVGRFAVVDESKFAKYSVAFHNALRQGDFAATFQRGHPAVITMWIGAISAGVQSFGRYGRFCEAVTIRPLADPEACALDELTLIRQMHIGYAWLTWALLAIAAFGLLRLYGAPRGALLLGWVALDPFLLAHARIAHHEGILSHALLASSLMIACYAQRREKRYLLASAVLGGVALAEKLPGSFAFAVSGAVLLYIALQRERGWARARWWAGNMALWSLLALGAVFAMWPALWADAPLAVQRILADVGGMLDEASSGQHLLLGQVRGAESTVLLYGLTLLFRLTPWALSGLAAALILAIRSRTARRELVPWLAYAAAFIAMMSFGVKQGGRYILSAFPAIDILAGLAWWRVGAALARRVGWRALRARVAPLAAMLLLCLAYVLPSAPYYLSAYNWLVGGPRVAARAIDMGLGEGLDRAADYLNRLPDAPDLTAASGYREAFAPFFVGRSLSLTYETIYQSDYAVFYINQWQRRPDWSLWQAYRDRPPEHVVTLHGVPYARIYVNPPPHLALEYLREATSPRDLVVAEIPSLLTRHYPGPAALWLPQGRWDEAREDLSERLIGADAAWWVIYPRSRGAYGDDIADLMRRWTEPVARREFPELSIEQRLVTGLR